MEEKYNGWANYYTWAVNLWLTNEEVEYKYYCNLAREISGGGATDPAIELADILKTDIEDGAPDLAPGMYSDLLGAALGRVNYDEIARAFLDAIR